jgi:AraC-like DNA-binding protein
VDVVARQGRDAVAIPCASPDRPARWIARQNTKPKNLHPTSTRHNVTNMDPIDEAVAAIESLDEGEHFTYTVMADQYGVSRTTLSRRHRQIQGSLEDMSIN